MFMQGYIKLHRKIMDNPLIKNSNYFHLWIVLLLKANHKETKMLWNNNFIVIKEGQLITGRKELSKETGIPETSIERILKTLENGHQIGQQKTTKYRLITILNWKEYQNSDIKTDNKRTTNGQQTDTNKNDKNVKNDNKVAETSSALVSQIIKEFEVINPACKRYYGNTTQRKACETLISEYGYERVVSIIKNTLPKTNNMQFFPTISTPLQLLDKWVSLEGAVARYKSGNTKNKSNIAFL